MIRHLQPTDIIQVAADPRISGKSVTIQSNGPCSFVVLSGIGVVTVQVNNSNFMQVTTPYGIGNSSQRLQYPEPSPNNSFSANWADTSLSADSSAANVFINRDIQRRYVRLSGAGITGTVVARHAFTRPRV